MNGEAPRLRASIQVHRATVNAATFSPDGELLVTAAGHEPPLAERREQRGETLVWHVASGQLAASLGWHRQAVLAAAVSPDGATLATGSRDQTVAIWNISRGLWDSVLGVCEQRLRGHDGAVSTLAFSPDGCLLAAGDEQVIRLWDTRDWRRAATLAAPLRAACWLAFSPDGRWLAAASRGRAPVVIWDVAGRQEALQLRAWNQPDFESRGLAFSPDGSKLAVLKDHEVGVWDLSSCRVLAEFAAQGSQAIAYSPLGDCLATGGWDPVNHSAVQFWDAGTGNWMAELKGHKLPVTALAFAPSGKLLASAGRDGLVNLWELPRLAGRFAPRRTS